MHSRRNLKTRYMFVCCLVFLTALISFASQSRQQDRAVTSIAVDRVWSGHRIKPYLLTRGKQQFVAYYDANRQMTVAHRQLGGKWRYYKVDSWLGWDSHNYVTMELDSEGYLHVMGNMHADPLEYFRMSEPLNVRSLKRVPVMTENSLEKRMTYPVFLRNKQDQLIVKYRDGGSGNGSEIYNIYNAQSKLWSRLHANTFLDGEGKMSGYFEGPTLGPDGMFHLIWVWRNTPNAATNHSLSYAKSEDLINWQNSNGEDISLPITAKSAEVVDPVPPFGGMINGNVKIGFDHNKQPIISYHKYDENGDTQVYVARKDGAAWKTVRISDWKGFRWDFGGHGSLGRFKVRPYAPELLADNNIGVLVRRNDEVMRFILNQQSLETVSVEHADIYPPIINAAIKAANPHYSFNKEAIKLESQVFEGKGDSSAFGKKFYLSWLNQPGNRDSAHPYISQPSVLTLTGIDESQIK